MNFTPAANLYGQFLQLARSVGTLPSDLALSPLEAVLLEEVFLHSRDKRPLTVKEAIELNHLASPSTLHKRITHLRKLQGGGETFAAADVKAERDKPGSPPQTRQRRAQILAR